MSDLDIRLRRAALPDPNDEREVHAPLMHEAAAELARLTAEVERLRADAGRYRWLREREYMDIAGCWLLPDGFLDPASPVAVDAAIDAAIKEAGNG